ncbi:flagellar assembly protein FliH [Corallococcus exiguus]|uniref:flagellar assembly protein FliH n=1 Tax=Corallococcus TaxID=83461 RepID=UPI000EBFF5EC|nr:MULTISPECIES: flagellar assembly protein FliH [Corallococcus]NNB89299.1 flagellar assembly protein FliH [Corallococcus exiguus]NNC00084.1 flagellar assembly protein FliH [Corallococcus exiguus]NNC06891.1 flagellar assembly protein FliH [Corallococcus exiguus]NPC50684.1 flagellar assembly protein FliH [Corallococcus exiguus]RKH77796.1 flagellar assembly protein FliH [Corallococcus sp. AB032C]
MPPYRLQVLLDMREKAKEEAEQAFSDAVKALAKEEQEQKRLEAELERRRKERKAKVAEYFQQIMAKGAGINGMNMMGRFEARLKDDEAQVALQIEHQKEVVRTAGRLVEQRRMLMAEAAKELKAIEKNKEKFVKQVKKEREDREELGQEEIGSALFLARQRK